MVKQVNITAYAVPKQCLPETPKRKRIAELVTAGQIEVISPSQASPEHKAGRKASSGDGKGTEASTPRTDTPLPEPSREDIKRKARGRPPHSPQPPRSSIPPLTQSLPTETPLPPSPTASVDLGKRKVEQPKKQDKSKEDTHHREASSEVEGDFLPSAVPTATVPVQKGPARKTASYAKTLIKHLRPVLPQWKQRRVVVTFPIKLPKSKAKRTEYLSRELNKFLMAAKKVSPNNRTIYVRKFKDHALISDAEKNYWIDSFGSSQMSHLMEYTHGFYANQTLRDGTFRLTVQIVVPITTEISPFLDNLNGLWSESNNKMVRDCNEQSLYNPKTVGWLLRSNWNMTSSDELQNTLDKLGQAKVPGLVFGVTFKTIPSPGPKPMKYDKDTAIRAVVVSTNAEYQIQAWDLLFKLYNNKASTKYPLNVAMHFVPTKDHPDIRNNPIAVQNITLLMDRQRMFLQNTFTLQCHALADPDREVPKGGTLREKLAEITSRTMGDKVKGAKLFHAISQRYRDGSVSYFITYHKAVEKEATSIISGFGAFIKSELGLDPDLYCFPIHVNPDHSWDPSTRTTTNSTVDFLSDLVEETADLQGDEDDEEVPEVGQAFEMDSKDEREFKRTTGLDDAETVANIAVRKRAKPKPVPQQIASDDRSLRSEMSGLTNYSSESKMSQHRKELRRSVDEKEEQLLTQGLQMEEMQKQMEEMRKAFQATMTDKTPTKTDKITRTNSDEVALDPEISPAHNDKKVLPENVDINDLAKWQDEQQLSTSFEVDAEGRQKYEVDPDGRVWTIGWDIPLDNPKGVNKEPSTDWFQVTSGSELATRAYARHLQDEGHEVVLSKTGSMTAEDFVVYVIVEDPDISQKEEQGSGQDTGPTDMEEVKEDIPKVSFSTNHEVQQFNPDTMSLDTDNQVQAAKSDRKEEDPSLSSASESGQSSSSQSTPSKAESDSSGASSTSSTSEKVQVSTKATSTKRRNQRVFTPGKSAPRKPNLTKSTMEATQKMVKMKSSPKVKHKAPSGGHPRQET